MAGSDAGKQGNLLSSGARPADGTRNAFAVAFLAVVLASCSSNTDPAIQLVQTSEAGAPVVELESAEVNTAATASKEDAAGAPAASDTTKPVAAEKTAETKPVPADEAQPAIAASEPAQEPKPESTTAKALPPSPTGQVLENGGPILTAGTMPEPPAAKKKGFLSSFFGSTPAEAKPAPSFRPAPEAKAKPNITLPSPAEQKRKEDAAVRFAALGAQDDGIDNRSGDFKLPGVRSTNLFEIKRKSGLDDDSDIDVYEDIGSYEVASAAGLARLAPNGLLKQRETVDTACLKPKLVRILKQIERHFGKRLVVTSGYRSPSYNKKVRGAAKSQHMYCAAVDVQMPGVPKFELARYARSMPGRGGVGTYCHSSIHIDIGPERDWNWKCGNRKT